MANLILTTPTNPGIASWSDGNALFGYPFPWYGSGKDGAGSFLNNIFFFDSLKEYTTLVIDDASILAFPGQSDNYVEFFATESITINGSLLGACADGGTDGSVGGTAGDGGAGAVAGTDGTAGTINAGGSQDLDEAMNMTNEADFGSRALGGTGGSGTSGAGGEQPFPSISKPQYYPPFRALSIAGAGKQHFTAVGGYGGAAGAGDGVNPGGTGGGGGGGGGAIVLHAPIITITDSELNASGGDGGNGQEPIAGNCGGGGGGAGGNGGIIIFVAEQLNIAAGTVTLDVDGGAGGTGGEGSGTGGLGGLGGQGALGTVYWYRPSTNTWTSVA